MRKVIYVPIIHTSADFGSVASDIEKKIIDRYGEEKWESHKKAISDFWDSIYDYFRSLDVQGFKIYQDGLVADGDLGMKIVKTAAEIGSKNYLLVYNLVGRGATIMKTEDINVVKKERDFVVKMAQSKSFIERLSHYMKYMLYKERLLKQRDKYIAKRINETLREGETGIVFLGALHNVVSMLPKDIGVIEVKKKEEVEKYEKQLQRKLS
ncbi:MAG: hypothetical protein H8D26_09085 [Methanomicrobia archaeon]|nr:hypothetical protein [Methanomicrobia archaeon]